MVLGGVEEGLRKQSSSKLEIEDLKCSTGPMGGSAGEHRAKVWLEIHYNSSAPVDPQH